MFKPRTLLGVISLTVAVPAGAQEVRLLRADTASAQVIYTYSLVGSAKEPRGLAEAGVDVTTPKGKYQPAILGIQGAFIMDALRMRYKDAEFGHAPLFIGVPSQWLSFISYEGALSWSLDTDRFPKATGAMPGSSTSNFIVKSPALTAFRKWTASARQPLPNIDEEDLYIPGVGIAKGRPRKATPPVFGGYVLAPGWMAQEATASYMLEQANIACSRRWLEKAPCAGFRALAMDLLRAEAGRQDAAYLDQLAKARTAMAASHSWEAHMVFDRTISALATRKPSSR